MARLMSMPLPRSSMLFVCLSALEDSPVCLLSPLSYKGSLSLIWDLIYTSQVKIYLLNFIITLLIIVRAVLAVQVHSRSVILYGRDEVSI